MFLECIQAVAKLVGDLIQYLLTLIGGSNNKNKKDDWAYDAYNPDYFQPQLYNAQQGVPANFRHRGFAADVDRNTNQASQSAATLPRPFYAPVRQHNAPNNLVNRAGQGNQQQKHKQSVVELLLQQQNEEVVPESTSLLGLAPIGKQSELSPSSSFDRLTPLPDDNSIIDFSVTENVRSSNSLQGSIPSYKYEPPKLLSPGGNQLGGLRGTRPLVKLDRMSFITKMMREGKDGVSMGDYAPDSRLHSINLGEASMLPLQPAGDTSATAETALNTEERPRIRNMAYSAYPTLDLKDLSLLDIIGGGGFGQVWRGTWGGTPVAVKLLSNLLLPVGAGNNANSPPNAEQAALLTAFEEEVSMLAQLRHPNICLFLGVCLEPPHRAIVTELVSRGSLWDCLRVKGLFQVCVF